MTFRMLSPLLRFTFPPWEPATSTKLTLVPAVHTGPSFPVATALAAGLQTPGRGAVPGRAHFQQHTGATHLPNWTMSFEDSVLPSVSHLWAT